MEMSFGLLFYPKKPKGYKQGDVPIYFRITVDGVERASQFIRSIPHSVHPLLFLKQSHHHF